MTTPITKEQLIARIETQKETALKHPECSVALMDLEIANIARAAMDAEPVYQWRERYEEGSLWEDCTKEQHDGFAKNPECEARVLYTAPPAPVLQEDIPDSVYEILCQACGGKAWMYEAALWDACRDEILKNSASAKPSTDAGCVTNNPSNCASVKSSTDAGCVTNTRSNCASVKDHQIRELVNELRDIAIEYHGTQQLRERIARTVRAAMFAPRGQAAPLLDSESKNTDSRPSGNEPVSQPYKLSFDHWMSQQEGSIDVECGCVMTEVLFHWMRVAYEAGNYPVIPDSWIPVSDRLPESKPGSYEYIVFETLNNRAHHDYWNVPDRGDDAFTPFWNHYGKYVTHWMPLPAAPQQEGN